MAPYHVIKNVLDYCTITDSSIIQRKELKSPHNSSLLSKPTLKLKLLVNQFNSVTPQNNNNLRNISSSKYYDIDDMHYIEIPNKNKYLFLFHMNACSLNKNFDDLQNHLSCTKANFDIIGVTKKRLLSKYLLFNNLNLNNSSMFCSSLGQTLLVSRKKNSSIPMYTHF